MTAISESFFFLETNEVARISQDLRLSGVSWHILNGRDTERQFGMLEPKLYQVELPMSFSDLIVDGKNYLKRNRVVLDTIDKLDKVKGLKYIIIVDKKRRM